jgi:flavin reductase (DIM6/NTAB) family NADH-FMN oxidoreductase RutF
MPNPKNPVPESVRYRLLNPGSVVLVSVGDGTRDNLFPVTWNMTACDDPPVVALLSSRDHFSFPFIERTGELGLNVPSAAMVDALFACGKTSGRDVPDKFARFGLTRLPATKIQAPLVAEAVACLECRVTQIVDVEGAALILARVVAAVADAEHFRDGTYLLDSGLQLLHHLNGPRFTVSERLVVARKPG